MLKILVFGLVRQKSIKRCKKDELYVLEHYYMMKDTTKLKPASQFHSMTYAVMMFESDSL